MSQDCTAIALEIIKNIKNIVETAILEKDYITAFSKLNVYIKKYDDLKKSPNSKLFNLSLFDNDVLYYKKLEGYAHDNIMLVITNAYSFEHMLTKFTSSFNIINFSFFTDLLAYILQKDKNAFKDKIIKCDISILIEILTAKSERMTNSDSLFLCLINELKSKYKNILVNFSNEEIEFIKRMEEKFKIEAKRKYDYIKSKIYEHISSLTFAINIAYNEEISQEYKQFEKDEKNKKMKEGKEEGNESEIKDTIKGENSKLDDALSKRGKFRKFCDDFFKQQDFYRANLHILRKKCEEFKSSFEYYAHILLKEYPKECSEKFLLENIVLPFQIIDIDINNIDNIYIIYNIPDNYKLIPNNYTKYQETFLGKYLEIKKELEFTKQRNYEKEIREILSDDQFFVELFSIFSSKNVSKYLKSRIKFKEKYEALFIENIDEEYDVCLDKQYEQFMNDMKGDFCLFRKYVVIKQLCYKIPAMTNSSMRIFINPVFEISHNIQNNELQLNSVLKSALFILFVHEITHFLKAYPINNKYSKEYPITPREFENGKCIIFYLFGISIIKSIDYTQALKINSISSWEDLNILRKLFEKSENDNGMNESPDTLDFYLTEEDDNTLSEKRSEYCLW